MKFILGTKQEMTQIFTEDGRVIPVTMIKAGPIIATQVKTFEKDGYEAVQFGFGKKKQQRINKSQKGHFKELGDFAITRECIGLPDVNVGDNIDVSVFADGDIVEVSGISKGKGFQSVVKRHGFHGGLRSHGQKHSEREPGSIGATGPQRVLKGTRMAGRMGSDRVTVKNLKIVSIDNDKGVLFISGAVPGHRGTLLEIRGKKNS